MAAFIIFLIGAILFLVRYGMRYSEAVELEIIAVVVVRGLLYLAGMFLMGYAAYMWGWRIIHV